MRIWFVTAWLFFSLHANSTDLFEDAVQLIKKYEGWHHARDQPYVGYGHRLLPTDTFGSVISESFADSLLRSDLKKKCAVFRRFGSDSLLLGVLAFNVGESQVLRSKLVKKLQTGDRNIREEYLSFRMYKGKVVRSLERRREEEYELLKSNVE
ncbi:glycoside hydrolase family protein [Bacteroides ovatus]|jgi:GH24 family phage-related lysozyme (muramidase)|uniref:glycoside hydrolase family protein n=1 Tax=Bacteroides ovatus TaxID=28116 RepID=UPI002062B3FF|nr:glycoside hydrolase [Bacteroides ovatus]UYI64243.1 MAG: glycoside hydrolase [Bacteroides ovatus]DAU81431.1 MAG TPA: lysozyme [Caudoviricetes sp.]